MTDKQYEKLVELVDSIEFIDKELIDTNKFIAKFHKIFSKDYEVPSTCPWAEKTGIRDIEISKTPFYDPIKIIYDGTGTGDPKIMYDGPGTGDNKVMYDGLPEYAPFYGIKYDKTHGVDEMKFTVSDDNTHSNTYRNTKSTNEMQCVEYVDQEATLQSKYTDPKKLDTV